MQIAARIGTMAASVSAKYVGLVEGDFLPFSTEEFVDGDFEFVLTATSNQNWTYGNYRFLTSGDDGTVFGSPIIIALYEDKLRVMANDANRNTIVNYGLAAGINFGNSQKFSLTREGLNYKIEVDGVVFATSSSSSNVKGSRLKIGHYNGAWDWVNGGSFDLTKSYITANGKLLWEGVEGAYERVSQLVGGGINA